MTNHPLDDAAQFDHQRSTGSLPAQNAITNDQRERAAVNQVIDEFKRAVERHGPMRSPHEGFGVLYEEVDELWDEIKKNGSKERMLAEAKQVAAMAIRLMVDVCGEAINLPGPEQQS